MFITVEPADHTGRWPIELSDLSPTSECEDCDRHAVADAIDLPESDRVEWNFATKAIDDRLGGAEDLGRSCC
jgi:hypothetical protein